MKLQLPYIKHARIVEARECTRRRTQFADHEDLLVEEGFNSLSHYNLLYASRDEESDAKTDVDKEWWIQKLSTWQLNKLQNKNEIILDAHRVKTKVHFATLMDIFYVTNGELEPK